MFAKEKRKLSGNLTDTFRDICYLGSLRWLDKLPPPMIETASGAPLAVARGSPAKSTVFRKKRRSVNERMVNWPTVALAVECFFHKT